MAGGMKDSGIEWVGEIPEEWRMGRIAHRYSLTLGKMVESETEDSSKELLPYLCAANLKWGGVDTSVQKEMWFNKAEQTELELREGDVLITEGGSVGTACIYHGEMGRCFFQNSVIRARGEDTVANEFLAYWLETVCSSGYLDTVCNKATISHYTKDKVSKTPMPSVPRSAVVAIVAALNEQCGKLSSALKTLEEQVDVLERYRRSLIHEAVTKGLDHSVPMRPSGIDWIGDIPEDWQLIPLKYLATIIGGFAFDSDDFKTDGAYRLLRGINVAVGKTRWDDTVYLDQARQNILSSYRLRSGDLVFGLDRPWIGEGLRSAIVKSADDPSYLVQRVAKITAGSKTTNEFLFYTLDLESVKSALECQTTGVSVPHISTFQLGSIPIALPSLAEQEAILSFIREKTIRIDTLLAAKREQIDILKKRRQSLIYEYVTGKRRVGEEA